MKILILYTELAGYTIACIEALVADRKADVLLVRYPVNAEAPFRFSFPDTLKIFNRKDFSENELETQVKEFKPEIILCSGWNDKAYTAICRKWKAKGIPVVLAMDNKWQGTVKQYAARVLAPFTLRKTFSHCWVPGESQKIYAGKLGFSSDKIATGFYACDYKHFSEVYLNSVFKSKERFPQRFVYAGRYYDFKGIEDLWKAFIAFKNETNSDWKLICLGTGDITPVVHPDIEHKGFLQPDEMAEFMKGGGVFVMPSRIEPWGVVVQEYAAAGFPLLLSDCVGAASSFLHESKNGYLFKAGDVKSIADTLEKVSRLSDENLFRMSASSHLMASVFTPEIWADTLLNRFKT
jgi:glycosyltransferase involved in cell wall biosynthesis